MKKMTLITRFLTLFMVIGYMTNSSYGCTEVERAALLECKQSFIDLYGMLSSWEGLNCCEWSGVGCDSITGHVIRLDLQSKTLQGSIPASVGNLTALMEINLSQNLLNDTIPASIGNLTALIRLRLGGNQLNGRIPASIGNLTALIELDLSYNLLLNDTIPASIGNLSSLKVLQLGRNQLHGAIPTTIGNLSALTDLDLSNNQLSGVVPDSIGRLANLNFLSLSSNYLTGNISETHFLNVSKLRDIRFDLNQLTITISHDWIPPFQLETMYMNYCKFGTVFPRWLGTQKKLQWLFLSHASITGPWPTTIGNLSSLKVLFLGGNLLHGAIPTTIGRLSNLETIRLSFNDLTGNISETHFLNLTKLKELGFSSNQLRITISHDWIPPFQLVYMDMSSCKFGTVFPRWLGTQKKLQWLSLSNASITGPWPAWLSNPLLRELDLSQNEISGHIPHNIRDLLPALQYFQLSNNLLNGTTPSSLCKMRSLSLLDISRNKLSGNIPNCLGNIQKLEKIELSFNKLTGVIPSSIGNLSWLGWLKLDNNRLKGDIPSSLINCKHLVVVDLGQNKLSGNIPTWIGAIDELTILKLRNNRFDGYIPTQLCQMLSLRVLDLADNNFTGNIPSCLGNLTAMTIKQFISDALQTYWRVQPIAVMTKRTTLEYTESLRFVVSVDLSSNNLVGVIPSELARLSALTNLNLSYNHLTGTIPKNIGNLTELESLDLSNNRLSGSISTGMSSLLSLSSLNLSHNNFVGRIPTGNQLQTLTDPSIYADNPNLCGKSLTKRCVGDDEPVHHVPDSNEEEDKSYKIWLCLAITIGYGVGLWAFFGTLMLKKKWRYAYFRYVDYTIDWIYVFIVVNARRLKRKMMGVEE